MADGTGIEWTDATWNPVRGCRRVSEGCRNCYAELVAARFSGKGQPYDGLARMTESGPRWTGVGRFISEHLADPLRWQRPRRVFVNSMSDLFFDAFTDEQIAAVFGIMALAPRHVFQVLTKRPERMLEFLKDAPPGSECVAEAGQFLGENHPASLPAYHRAIKAMEPGQLRWPLPNVWLGTSVENQAAADERIPLLVKVPAAVRFLSCEPLLGPVFVGHWLTCRDRADAEFEIGHGIDWVIIGGESGPGARPLDIRWVADLVQQCTSDPRVRATAFVKQLGAVPMEPESDWRGRTATRILNARNRDRVPADFVPLLYSGKGGDIDEWPTDLRVRQMPAGVR